MYSTFSDVKSYDQPWMGISRNILSYGTKTSIMSPAAKSVYYFGFYLYLVSFTLVFFPNILLRMLHIPETNEVWIRVLGVLVGLIGFYYQQSGAKNISAFFPLTIPTRVIVLVAFVLFAVFKMASPILIGFGAIDFAGAIWTMMALKKG
jgi:hypothetical protein